MGTSRRDVLKITAATAAILATGRLGEAEEAKGGAVAGLPLQTPASERKGEMLYRTLGRTGEKVSLIGLGGFHVGSQREESESIRIIRSAIDRGITFMDNCWDYHNGGSEVRMGNGLKDGYREKVFLMTKIDGRTKKAASRQIEESLKRLQTDHIDLLQHHEIIRMEDPDRVFAENGSMEAALEAKKAGKVRYIGFTGHKDPSVHLRMLEIARQHDFHFDAAQMPLNIMDAQFRSFGKEVVPVLVKEGVGVLGMKSMGAGHLLRSGTVTAIECLHYAMTLPTSVVITGIDSMKILDQAFEAAKTFEPLTQEQVAGLMDRSRKAAMSGKYEMFKTSAMYDGTASHPEWLG